MKINLIINLKDKDSSLSFYQYYPRLFKAYFPKVNEIIIEELSDAGYLYFQSTLALDQLIDNKNIQKIFEITILQEESIKLLTDIFGYDSIFWKFWNNSRNDYIEAIKIDHRLRNSKDVAFEEYQELADKKSTFGKIAIYSLKILSNTEDANIIYQKILLSHYYFSIGLQLYDDVKDLKEDYTNNQFNWSIYLLKKEIGNNNFSFETLNKLFYIKGIAEKVLSTSLDNFRKSINILKEIGIESEWLTVNLDMYETINNYLHITKGYIKILYKKLEVKKTERPSQKFINYETINKSYISKGLEFIKKDFDSNYVDLKHYMYLGELDDFCNENDVHESDTFQRTILNDCLLDILIKENSLDQNYFYFKNELDYLISKVNKDDIGGWSYFPSVKEISADIDDLGQVIQLFFKLGRNDLIEKYCLSPVETAISDRTCENGGIETWILPKNNLNDLQKIQNEFNTNKWGKGPDVEVVANFIYSLHLIDKKKYKPQIINAINYIIAQQNEEGFWESRWYYGRYYGTFVCLRLLKEYENSTKSQIEKALEFIRKTQNSDGSFSNEKTSKDSLNTAYALLCLKLFLKDSSLHNVKIAENYLKKTQSNGFWMDSDFIKPKQNEPYKSKVLTTAIVLKSLC